VDVFANVFLLTVVVFAFVLLALVVVVLVLLVLVFFVEFVVALEVIFTVALLLEELDLRIFLSKSSEVFML
jgi:hypothetical protein